MGSHAHHRTVGQLGKRKEVRRWTINIPQGIVSKLFPKQHVGEYVWDTLSTLDYIVTRTKLYPQ